MIALLRGGTKASLNDYAKDINQVKAKQKAKLYYA